MVRTPCCEKAHTNKGAWTKEEDQLLVDYIRVHGEGNWRSLPKAAGLLRCGKSCRLRWINYLRPDVKRGNFSAEEDEIIIKLHSLLGNRWSLIAGRLPGRTDNEIKNYWNTHIRRKLISSGIDPQTHRPLNSAAKAGRNFINSIPPPPPSEEKVMISMIEPTKILSFPATDNSSSIHDTNCNSSTTEESQPPPPPPQEEENGVDALDLELSIGLPFQSKYTKAASFKLRRPAGGIVQFKAEAEVAPPPPSMCVCRALGFQKDRFCSICQCRNRSYRYC